MLWSFNENGQIVYRRAGWMGYYSTMANKVIGVGYVSCWEEDVCNVNLACQLGLVSIWMFTIVGPMTSQLRTVKGSFAQLIKGQLMGALSSMSNGI